jgi:RHH-type proline utilization regulon transcriptional repressor/proline dehydrogenase/delta 1-pyrroline-5-carboxylate dehydrogenase
VITPWNFPVAIPAGGIIAALITGNTVIVKPASAAALTAYQLCQCFWEAGISKKVLQFLPCRGEGAGETLSTHKDVDFVIFTGGTDAAMRILEKNPTVHISAETGGKNATIVTAMADRDLAIKNVLHSAFSNVGQKCSATSLLILEGEVYDDPRFKSALVDAARSMPVGSPWELQNRIGPLIQPPKGDLKTAIDALDPGESWALEPGMVDHNPYIISPGVKWGVAPGNFCHTHELFGPVIAVMRADNLEHAIEMVNATGYGLTSGLESLDEREHAVWRDQIKAGNLYINRSTTGAIVLRQPFGGMGKSAIGAGIKAGGWNYVTQFTTFSDSPTPPSQSFEAESVLAKSIAELDPTLFHNETATLEKLAGAIASYEKAHGEHFAVERDYVNLRGEENMLRYLPRDSVLLRLRGDESLFDILAVVCAVKIAQIPLTVALSPSEGERTHQIEILLDTLLDEGDTIAHRDDETVASILDDFDAVRYIGEDAIATNVYQRAARLGKHIHADRPVAEGRIELINYFLEQSITYRYHRYGNLGKRGE